MASAQSGEGFPQGSARQEMICHKRLAPIDDHHVQITMKLAVLKAVVKDKNDTAQPRRDICAGPETVL
jgi:hypothetical protein